MSGDRTAASNKKIAPWYAGGLRFTCARCGRCCGGAPGYVWVEQAEIAPMAAHLAMETREFRKRFCRNVWWRVSLRERPNGDCVMLTPGGCSVYEARPAQCRTFPFWADNVRSAEAWEALKRRCPGAGQGRLYSAEQIERIAASEGAV